MWGSSSPAPRAEWGRYEVLRSVTSRNEVAPNDSASASIPWLLPRDPRAWALYRTGGSISISWGNHPSDEPTRPEIRPEDPASIMHSRAGQQWA